MIRFAYCITVFFLFLSHLVWGQDIFNHIPYIKNFSTSDYRAEAQNRAILQDKAGIIYFGNGKGLLRFDGKNWDLIPMPNKSAVRSMDMDADGRLYVGGQGDFGYLEVDENGISHMVSIAQKMSASYRNFEGVSNIYCQGKKVIFHTISGTYIFQDGAITLIKPQMLFQYAFRVGNAIYVNETGVGLKELQGNRYIPVVGGEIFANERIDLMLPFGDQKIMLFVRNKGVYEYTTGNTPSIKKSSGFVAVEEYIGSDPVDDGKVLMDSIFAIATKDKGLVLFNHSGEIVQAISRENGIITEQILSVFFDKNFNIWLGLEDGISFVSLQSPYTNYNEESGLRGIVLCAIEHEGKLYIGTTQGIFWQYYVNGRIKGRFKLVAETNGGECWNLVLAKGKLLAAHTNGLLEISENKAITKYDQHVWAIEPYMDNYLLLGTYSKGLQLMAWDGQEWKYKHGIAGYEASARYIQTDAFGKIWISHPYKGIYRLEVSPSMKIIHKTDFFTTANGLPSNTSNYVYEMPQGLIFGTENGFYQFQESNHTFIPYQRFNDSLPKERPIKKIAYDINGHLWYSTGENVGFFAFDPSSPNITTQHEKVQKLNSTLVYSLTPLKDGNMLFGISNGFLFLNKEAYDLYAQDKHKVFNTFISSVENVVTDSLLAGTENVYSIPELENAMVFPHYINSLRFNFSSSFFEDHEKCQFQYFLEGYEDQFNNWTTKSTKEYTNLSPGKYTFRVKCMNVYNNLGQEAVFRFEIKSPWYATNLAYFLYIFGLLLSFVFGVQIYNQRLHRKNKELAQKISAATAALRETNDEIAKKNDELIELNEDKNHLIGIVAHDLRSPLNQMKGFVNIIKITGHNLTTEQKEYLGTISTTLDRLNLMIRNILDVNAAMFKTVVLDYEEIDALVLVKEIVEAYKKQATKKHIKIHIQAPAESVPIKLDPNYLHQILDNLISNAVKYTWRGKEIHVVVSTNQNTIRFSIKDQGPGLTEQDLKKLFNKYQKLSAKPTGGESSTGLGLSIVKKYAEAMHGKVWAENGEGEGAVFIVEFPQTVSEHRA